MTSSPTPKKALICGISGQDGAYLAKLLLSKGYAVFGTARDAQMSTFANLRQVGARDAVTLSSMALSDFRSVIQTLARVEPDEIYNLAGQSSVGLSFEQPVETLESISVGTLNLLEALRFTKLPARLYHAGSSECFGDTRGAAANESNLFHPRSPYAVAKAAAHWEVTNYREAYDLWACTGILFNHESPLRPERFVTRKIVKAACRISRGSREQLHLGNIQIARDWGWAPEYVEAMWRMLQQPAPEDFVIATGETNTLEAFVAEAFRCVGLEWRAHVELDAGLLRPSDIMVSRADPRHAAEQLGWKPTHRMADVVREMVAAELRSAVGDTNR
ncbi:MAG TPA: GDP-mannose 4,6-dehydratase [Polyangia bacterium]|jgi:GDPmannose 4,6-dehydratase